MIVVIIGQQNTKIEFISKNVTGIISNIVLDILMDALIV